MDSSPCGVTVFPKGTLFKASKGGNVNQSTSNLFNNAGANGYYWSSTPYSSGSTQAYNLNFNGTTSVNPSNNNNRQNGFSVRCPYCARSPPCHES